MVVEMFINDIVEESQDDQITDKLKHIWRQVVITWLKQDGYYGMKEKKENGGSAGARTGAEPENDESEKKDDTELTSDDEGVMFGLFS